VILDRVREEFFRDRERIKENHFKGETGFHVADDLRIALDKALKPAVKEFFSDWDHPCAIYALGGYGRGELNFHSDIDVTLIYDGNLSEKQEKIIESFYYYLLTFKLDLGFAARSINETISLSLDDISIFTNLLQRRFLWGSEEIKGKLSREFEKLIKLKREAIINEILISRRDRHRRFYGTVYYQEPNVKESKGGLRELHEAFWISKIVYGIENYSGFLDSNILDWKSFRDVISAYDFMLRVRNQLHIISGRKSDILSFEMQKDVAKFFGFKSDKKGIESFMKNYINAAIDLSVITREIIKRSLEKKQSKVIQILKGQKFIDNYYFSYDGSLYIDEKKEKEVIESPEVVLKGFKIIQDKGLNLSAGAFRIFKLSADMQSEKYRQESSLKIFKEILLRQKRLSYTLELMHDCGVLDALIPDFGRIRGHFQFDIYHKFTTDIHLILTVREIEKIAEMGTKESSITEKGKFYQVLHDIENPHTLYLAALFHDIGKGKKGKHEITGARITRKYLRELGFPEEDISETEWLVKNHLLMSHLAFRRDVGDPELIRNFAAECENEEKLKKLFILTYADIKAVGPGAWDRWKSSLLWELFLSTLYVFTQGKPVERIIDEKLERRKKKVLNLLSGKSKEEKVKQFLTNVERDYLVTYPSAEIEKHFLLLERMKTEGKSHIVSFENFPNIGYTEITIITEYRRGLFHKIAGLLSSFGINIKGAKINRIVDNYMVYTVQASTIADEPVPDSKLADFEKILDELYKGTVDVESLVEGKLEPKSFRTKVPKPETKVKFDNRTSEKFTIVEVSTYDRIGVLYAITKQLLLANTRLRMAKIATEGNRVIDAFYITDINYKKITDEEKLNEIREKIFQALKE
jgi:[protein-PII] uridylyltransferase